MEVSRGKISFNQLCATTCYIYISIPVLIVVNDNSIYICCRKRIKETCTSYIVHNLLIARTGVRFGSRVVHSSLVEFYVKIFASKKVVLLYSKKLIYISVEFSVCAIKNEVKEGCNKTTHSCCSCLWCLFDYLFPSLATSCVPRYSVTNLHHHHKEQHHIAYNRVEVEIAAAARRKEG